MNKIFRSYTDTHLNIGPATPIDPVAAQLSCELDAARDRDWFRKHPRRMERTRMPSAYEVAAHNLPPGSKVHVRRGPLGSQIRSILPPN